MNKVRRPLMLFAVLASLILSGLYSVSNAAPSTSMINRINTLIQQYKAQHPTDLAGIDRLVYHYTGSHLQVMVSGVDRVMNGQEAQRYFAVPTTYPTDASGGGIPVFKLAVYVNKIYGHPKERQLTGTWNFPDSWAGQKNPPDDATIETDLPSCYQMMNMYSDTFSTPVSGKSTETNRGTLRDANLKEKSPIWDIHDYTKGFNDQADSGYVSVIIRRKCSKAHSNLGTVFAYQATEGGSVTSVSAGYGFFSVSSSGTELKRKQSTKPLYFSL